MPRRYRIPALTYAALSLALWPLPLFGLLHVESAAVVATAGFFIAGLSSIGIIRGGGELGSALRGHLALLSIPWLLLTVTLLWRANCGYVLGLELFLLFTIPSVALAVAVAYTLSGLLTRWHRMWFVAIGLAVATLPVASDLLFHPQLYTYNHVFGGVLGPIYDEELAIRPGLFAFRGLTLLWTAWLVLLGRWLRTRGSHEGLRVPRAGVAVSVVIALVYAFSVPLGFNTSTSQIEDVLSGVRRADNFVIHYQEDSLTKEELAWIEDEHEYRYVQLREKLGVEVSEPIHTYLYPDPETRAALIGSRTTSVTPVWLGTPQIHMLADEFTADHFGHELAHVFAREFGMPIIHASLAVGLVEGLAVATEPPDGLPEARYQVAATIGQAGNELGKLDAGPADAITHAMNPFGFWSGRGAVSYATSGAFVGYLLETYGAPPLREAYRTGNFQKAYGQPLRELAGAWESDIRSLEPDPEAVAIARWRFSQPSLFERHCPHHVPRETRLARRAAQAEERGDLESAARLYREAIEQNAAYPLALDGWGRFQISEQGDIAQARSLLRGAIQTPTGSIADDADIGLIVRLADTYKVESDSAAAWAMYDAALTRLPPYASHSKTALLLRRTLSPVALTALLRPASEPERVGRLQQLAAEEPALWWFVAGAYGRLGEFTEAVNAIRRLPRAENITGISDSASRDLVDRTCLALRAQYADRAADYALVRFYADDAERAVLEAGGTGLARLMGDLGTKARWFLNRYGAIAQ